jgi:hypothetical protein
LFILKTVPAPPSRFSHDAKPEEESAQLFQKIKDSRGDPAF